MQVDHSPAVRCLMQAIDILNALIPFKAGQGMVRAVGLRVPEMRPAGKAARPVAFASQLVVQKRPNHHWWAAFPFAGRIAVVRNARFGTASGAVRTKSRG